AASQGEGVFASAEGYDAGEHGLAAARSDGLQRLVVHGDLCRLWTAAACAPRVDGVGSGSLDLDGSRDLRSLRQNDAGLVGTLRAGAGTALRRGQRLQVVELQELLAFVHQLLRRRGKTDRLDPVRRNGD